MRGNATANTPVTGQRPSHKMDFMTPIDTTRSLSPSFRRRCPISVPLSLSMDNRRRLCLPIPLERPLLESTSFRQAQGKPRTEYNSFVCRVYSLRQNFSIPFSYFSPLLSTSSTNHSCFRSASTSAFLCRYLESLECYAKVDTTQFFAEK